MSQANERIDEAHDNPGLPVKPPIIFVITLAIGVGIHWLWPQPARPNGWAIVGIALTVLAVALVEWAAYVFRKADTNVLPWKPTRVIVDRGPYAVTRNPIYVGFALLQVGLGLWTNRLAVVLMVIPAIIATNMLVIAREERYLEGKFGAVYLDYKQRVRRWL